MRVQFVSKRDPSGPILYEKHLSEFQMVPRTGEYVVIPGYRETIVDRVMWVFDEHSDVPNVAVVLG